MKDYPNVGTIWSVPFQLAPKPILDLEIHELPSLYNVFMRKHWSAKKKETDYWHRLVQYQVNKINFQKQSKKALPPKLERYQLELARHSSTEPDYDGLVGSFKLVVDGLRHANVIADDRLSNSGPWNVSWVKCAKNQGKIEVRVYAA